MSTSCWHLEGTAARLESPALTAAVDTRRPASGLHGLMLRGAPLGAAWQILGVGAPDASTTIEPAAAESYARGADLVVTYPQTEARPFRLQAYWRVLDLGALAAGRILAAVELQVSINTSLLDTRPTVAVASHVDGAEQLALNFEGNDIALFRPRGQTFSYVEAVHPVDRTGAGDVVAEAAGLTSHTWLFGRHLEKGVILRARIRGAFIARDDDQATAATLYGHFCAAPLPLTT